MLAEGAADVLDGADEMNALPARGAAAKRRAGLTVFAMLLWGAAAMSQCASGGAAQKHK